MVEIELRPEEFALFQRYVYDKVGISLSDQKTTLVKGRLNKRLNELGMRSFREYYDYLSHDPSGDELAFFVSAISTNVTSFFREGAQWQWLETNLPKLLASKRDKKIRIWSAGCSSGEEPYTILMFLQHHLIDFDQWDIKILATDISPKVLTKAMAGVYESKSVESLSRQIVVQSFEKIRTDTGYAYRILPHLRSRVLFRLYNLVTDPFFFKNRFDMIFCRNVMIYFDEKTRHDLIGRFASILPKDAPLFLGSSESLTSHRDTLRLAGASIYQRI